MAKLIKITISNADTSTVEETLFTDEPSSRLVRHLELNFNCWDSQEDWQAAMGEEDEKDDWSDDDEEEESE